MANRDQTQLKVPNAEQQVLVTEADLPVHCPMPGSSLWNSHPRVYIPLQDSQDGKAICPYCGTSYRLQRNR